MGVQSVSGPEPSALAASSAARTPRLAAARPRGDVEVKLKRASQQVRAGPEPSKEQSRRDAPRVVSEPRLSEAAGVRMRVDESTDRVVAQIVNETNQVIKQIPPEELLKVLAKTRWLLGVLFDREA